MELEKLQQELQDIQAPDTISVFGKDQHLFNWCVDRIDAGFLYLARNGERAKIPILEIVEIRKIIQPKTCNVCGKFARDGLFADGTCFSCHAGLNKKPRMSRHIPIDFKIELVNEVEIG